MPASYSYDLRLKAINAVNRGEKKTQICRMLKISRNTLDLWLKKQKETGDVKASTNISKGRKPKIKDEEKFREFVKHNQDKTQKQMAQLWGDNITQQNISYSCQKLGITRKKKLMAIKKEMNTFRTEFLKKLEEIETKRKVYVDEAGFDNREDYPYGYSPKGERCYALKCGKKRERVSWISALKSGKIIAPLTFEGTCNRNLFETWLAQSLIPQLSVGDIIILDNASFHKGENIKEIISSAGCELWYLPPYSPDLNKIENWWAVLKIWMKQRLKEFNTVRDCVDAAFKECPKIFA